MVTTPERLSVRAYQVGFGDCLLLTFDYPAAARSRHVLIDFGSSGFPRGAKLSHRKIASAIRRDCGGALDVVVATHRHSDHIKGFGGSAGKIIAGCSPRVVIQPWTEHPDAAVDGESATVLRRRDLSPERSFVAALSDMSRVAEWIHREGRRRHLRRGLAPAQAEELAFLGAAGIANRAAVQNLLAMGKKGRTLYVRYGSELGLDEVLPGVEVHVLGPPDLSQSQAIRRQRHRDEDQFWHLQAIAGDSLRQQRETPLFPDAETAGDPLYARWFRTQLSEVRGDSLLRIVRALDSALNNTSVILLFVVGGRGFLFPGDAQVESWSYALSQDETLELLKTVRLYKVGHHGSLNATPRQLLWNRFVDRLSTIPSPDRLHTVLSTRAGKHGHAEDRTEVPRETLLDELRRRTNLLNTQDYALGEISRAVEFDL